MITHSSQSLQSGYRQHLVWGINFLLIEGTRFEFRPETYDAKSWGHFPILAPTIHSVL